MVKKIIEFLFWSSVIAFLVTLFIYLMCAFVNWQWNWGNVFTDMFESLRFIYVIVWSVVACLGVGSFFEDEGNE